MSPFSNLLKIIHNCRILYSKDIASFHVCSGWVFAFVEFTGMLLKMCTRKKDNTIQ